MNFLDKLKKKFNPPPEHVVLLDLARQGESLEALVTGQHFQVLLDEILDPMYQEAFKTWTKINPENFSEVCQAQKMGQLIEEIKMRVERKITAGRVARQQLIDLAQEAPQ